jgi:hypothetical protein
MRASVSCLSSIGGGVSWRIVPSCLIFPSLGMQVRVVTAGEDNRICIWRVEGGNLELEPLAAITAEWQTGESQSCTAPDVTVVGRGQPCSPFPRRDVSSGVSSWLFWVAGPDRFRDGPSGGHLPPRNRLSTAGAAWMTLLSPVYVGRGRSRGAGDGGGAV